MTFAYMERIAFSSLGIAACQLDAYTFGAFGSKHIRYGLANATYLQKELNGYPGGSKEAGYTNYS